MPIRIPDGLPARATLVQEGVMVMDETTATRQDIRPLQIGLLNLMPNKITTETQIARLVGATPLQVDLTLVRVGSYVAKNTSEEHLLSFYQTWEKVADRKFDGFIITGAPVEMLSFDEVAYWAELKRIFDWTATNVHSTFFICWGAMAAGWHFHKLPKYALPRKAFGVFRHRNLSKNSPYLAGFSDDFAVSVSRWTEVRRSDLQSEMKLEVLMDSDETGLCLIAEERCNRLYMFNHIEYDTTSLADEYFRDIRAGADIQLPQDYFPGNDPLKKPVNRWRSHAFLLFGNWINHTYQSAPHDLMRIGNNR
jgi:homoserine O-succinyltransferase/O-acetyltransferase